MGEEVPTTHNGDLHHRHSDAASQTSRSDIVYRNRHKPFSMWRPRTYLKQNGHSGNRSVFSDSSVGSVSNFEKEIPADFFRELGKRLRWNTLVTVMVVQAKGLPQTKDKSSMYCKIRLGTEIYKTKSVTGSPQPEWKEQFQLHIYRDHVLKVSLWDKDEQKNFMGSCTVDLTKLDKERTHELRLDLDDGFGEVHLCVTLCIIRDDTPTPTEEETTNGSCLLKKKCNDLKLVGQLQVTAVAARGLRSKPSAYCTLQLHNQRVQTHSVSSSNDPVWNKRYTLSSPCTKVNECQKYLFSRKDRQLENIPPTEAALYQHTLLTRRKCKVGCKTKCNCMKRSLKCTQLCLCGGNCVDSQESQDTEVHDITSTLDVSIKDSSIKGSFRYEHLGKVSIPLFRIANGELRWFALKDKNKRNSAKGNHPRVLLQTSIVWNPMKAALNLFTPKEVKYIEKPRKFDLDVVYKNVIVIQDLFDILHSANDSYMRLFEWDNQELSLFMLIGWLVFWFYFKPWTIPLLLLAPFVFHLIIGRSLGENVLETGYRNSDDSNLLNTSERHDQNLKGKIKSLPEVSMNIIANIELVVSLAERLYNLATFKVPFLSYVAMTLLLGTSFAIYFIPFNYMMIALGLYKFARKHLNPNRTWNNDFVDFISRIPDNELWKDWKELSVPEPVQRNGERGKLVRSVSGPGPVALLTDPS